MLYPTFKRKIKRINSFSQLQLANIWAECGFFENNQRSFTCFYCGLTKSTLPSWCIDPWKLHYGWNPFCDFIKLKKGIPSVSNIKCIVCFEKERNVVLFPCKHLVLCKLCAEKLKTCVICRQFVVNILEIFLS